MQPALAEIMMDHVVRESAAYIYLPPFRHPSALTVIVIAPPVQYIVAVAVTHPL